MSSEGQMGQNEVTLSDREKVERIAVTMEGLIGLLDAYAGELEAELSNLDPQTDAPLITMLRFQMTGVRAYVELMEAEAVEHLLRMKDRVFLLKQARAGLLF